MECNGWNLSWTKVWSNKKENETVWNEKKKTLNPRSKLNNENAMIGPHEAISYGPMID